MTAEKRQKRLERKMRWHMRRAFWYGFFHPWNTEEKRIAYARKSLAKLEQWCAAKGIGADEGRER